MTNPGGNHSIYPARFYDVKLDVKRFSVRIPPAGNTDLSSLFHKVPAHFRAPQVWLVKGLLKNHHGGGQAGLRPIEKVDTNVQSLAPQLPRRHQTTSVAPQMRQDAQRLWLEALYCTVSIIGTFSGTCGWSRWRWLMNLRQSALYK